MTFLLNGYKNKYLIYTFMEKLKKFNEVKYESLIESVNNIDVDYLLR
jgi:hypothetical protein